MNSIHIIGMGMDHNDLPPTLSALIQGADILVGGERIIKIYEDHSASKIVIKSPLDDVIEDIRQSARNGKKVVVLADGDPLFFGIWKRLIKSVGKENIEIHPNVTALQTAASRLKIGWENIEYVSLHGRKDIRPLMRLMRALAFNDYIAVYTDQKYHPGAIADELIKKDVEDFKMHVFENLGQDDERINCFEPQEATKTSFSPLNLVILERVRHPQIALHLGLDDELFIHEKGLITKKEIRAVGLSTLEIEPDNMIWDLGSGSGSIAIEASLLAREGTVIAVEKNPSRAEIIRRNIKRTGALGVEVLEGRMPGCLKNLPAPDRIFIGGGLSRETGVLDTAMDRLRPGGKIVIHLVLMGSLDKVRDCIHEKGWPSNIIQVQVSRSRDLAGDQRLEALNPVYILSTQKPE